MDPMKIRHPLFALATLLLAVGLQAGETKPADTGPKFAYGLMLKQGDKILFSPCRDRSYAIMEDVSVGHAVTTALDSVGLSAGKKLYVELLAVVEEGVLKASGINMAQTDGRCQLPGTREEAWRAAGNEPGWLLAAGGDRLTLKRPGQPDVNVPYAAFAGDEQRASFDAAGLSVRLDHALCRDTMANAVFGWTASVTANGQALKGCAWQR
jgi:putative lipoprotein